jgi:hypothetical protein
LDRLINDREDDEDEETVELINKLVPMEHIKYKIAFSKVALDRLPPHRAYDYKI